MVSSGKGYVQPCFNLNSWVVDSRIARSRVKYFEVAGSFGVINPKILYQQFMAKF